MSFLLSLVHRQKRKTAQLKLMKRVNRIACTTTRVRMSIFLKTRERKMISNFLSFSVHWKIKTCMVPVRIIFSHQSRDKERIVRHNQDLLNWTLHANTNNVIMAIKVRIIDFSKSVLIFDAFWLTYSVEKSWEKTLRHYHFKKLIKIIKIVAVFFFCFLFRSAPKRCISTPKKAQ